MKPYWAEYLPSVYDNYTQGICKSYDHLGREVELTPDEKSTIERIESSSFYGDLEVVAVLHSYINSEDVGGIPETSYMLKVNTTDTSQLIDERRNMVLIWAWMTTPTTPDTMGYIRVKERKRMVRKIQL